MIHRQLHGTGQGTVEGPINWIPVADIVIAVARARSTQPVAMPLDKGGVLQAEPSKKLNIFLQLGMRVDLNKFWWTREPTWRTFKKIETFFQKKNPNSQPKFFGCEFGKFFLPKKKVSIFF